METVAPITLHVRRLSRIALLLHLSMLAVLVAGAWRLFPEYRFLDALLVGAAPYVAYAVIVRPLLTRHHRAGIRHLRREQFAQAAAAFEESVAFFTRNPLLDRFRFVVLLGAGAASYRELAMCNIGYAKARLGDFENAKEWYSRALSDYPECGHARLALDSLAVKPS